MFCVPLPAVIMVPGLAIVILPLLTGIAVELIFGEELTPLPLLHCKALSCIPHTSNTFCRGPKTPFEGVSE